MLLFLSFPAILPKKLQVFVLDGPVPHPNISWKMLGCKNWYFDIIEENVILCVLEMSALGTTLMTVSL